MEQSSGRSFALGSLLFLAFLLFLNFCSRMILSPLLLSIEEEFGISHAQGGSFFLITTFGYSVTMLFSGFLSHRLGHRTTIIVSVYSFGAALFLLASSTTIGMVKLGLLLLGIGGGLYAPSGMSTIPTLAESKHWGKAYAIHEIGPLAAFVAAPLIAEIVLRYRSWQTAYLFLSIGALVGATSYMLFGKGGRLRGEQPRLYNLAKIIKEPAFRILALFFVLSVGLELGVYAMLPTFMVVEHNIDRGLVNTIVSLSRISGIVFIFVSGILVDKIGERLLIGVICSVTGALTILLGIVTGKLLIVVIFLQPLLITAFFPAAFSALAKMIPHQLHSLSISLLIPAAYLFGAGVVPTFIGFLADLGLFPWGFIILGAGMFAVLTQLKRVG